MGIKKSDAKFTEPFVGTTEVVVMMSVQGGRSISSAVRLDYNAVHALEKAIVDYTFLDDTSHDHYTDKFVKVSDRECPWCKAVCASTDKYCHECGWHIADTPQTDCGWGEPITVSRSKDKED